MSDRQPAPDTPETPRLRWQIVVLALGVLLIITAVIVMLVRRPAATVEEPPPEVQTVQYVDEQVYTEAVVGQPRLVNPLLASTQVDRDLAALVYSGLTRLDEYGQPIPDLAESWQVSRDGLTYTFTLRTDVTWHDGQPFTAEDVAFTMGLLRNPDFPAPPDLQSFWQTVETYADDDHTVRFMLTQPLTAFPEYAGIGLLPAHLLAGLDPAFIIDDTFNLAPVGTGRLRWAAADVSDDGERITAVHLTPHDDYYDAARAVTLDAVTLRFYENGGDAFRTLGTTAQGFAGLTSAQLQAALNSPSLDVYTTQRPAYSAIIFNQQAPTRLPFFFDPAVRRALIMGLDRHTIIHEVLPRQAVVANSPLLPGTWAYVPVEPPPYDPAQAEQLLAEAGWPLTDGTRAQDETPLAFTLLTANRAPDEAIGELVAEQWATLGVDVTVASVSPADLLDRLQTTTEEGRDFDAALVTFSQGRLADPDPYPFWHESQIDEGQNYSGFVDYDVDQALEIARKDPNGVRRAELYAEFQRLFWERGAAALLYYPLYHMTVSCQVQGVDLMLFVEPADRFRNLHEWAIVGPAERDAACPTVEG